MIKASEEKIYWLLYESGLTKTEISKLAGMPLTTITDLVNRNAKIEFMRFNNAARLTEVAEDIMKQSKQD